MARGREKGGFVDREGREGEGGGRDSVSKRASRARDNLYFTKVVGMQIKATYTPRASEAIPRKPLANNLTNDVEQDRTSGRDRRDDGYRPIDGNNRFASPLFKISITDDDDVRNDDGRNEECTVEADSHIQLRRGKRKVSSHQPLRLNSFDFRV